MFFGAVGVWYGVGFGLLAGVLSLNKDLLAETGFASLGLVRLEAMHRRWLQGWILVGAGLVTVIVGIEYGTAVAPSVFRSSSDQQIEVVTLIGLSGAIVFTYLIAGGFLAACAIVPSKLRRIEGLLNVAERCSRFDRPRASRFGRVKRGPMGLS